MGNKNSNIDLEITEGKIKNLENELDHFINNQAKNIKTIFSDKNYKKQNIEYNIDANNMIEINSNDLFSLDDYVIKWSIQGSNKANSTKCHLTLFNIGGFLGAHGFLYSISLFYYYFMKIPIENRPEEEIKKDIDNCLKCIDKGEINKLNAKWNVHLNEIYLNDLKKAKDFLINLFNEKITNNLTEKLSKEKYINKKNNINRSYLINKILRNLELKTFERNNIFVIANDNDIDPWKNYGATFKGYYLEGLGEMHFARKLVENSHDGFESGNDPYNQSKELFNFYKRNIENIKLFFIRNQEKIDNINKGINIEINMKSIGEDLNFINQKYIQNEDIIDNEIYITKKNKEKNLEPIIECEISTN